MALGIKCRAVLSVGLLSLLGLASLSVGSLVGAAEESWHAVAGGRWRLLVVPAQGGPGFTAVPQSETGVRLTNHLADLTVAYNRVMENGSGVALGDVDGDGWCDLYFCRLEGPNVLYRNRGGWQFEDITESAGVACPGQRSTGAALADLDGDGAVDLLVNAIGGGTRAFLNDGRGRFREVLDGRLDRKSGSTSMALADIDGDGDLDLYVTNYRTNMFRDRPPDLKFSATLVDGRVVVEPADRFLPLAMRTGGVEVFEKGERHFLYLNDGRGRFAPVSWTSGAFLDEEGRRLTAPVSGWGLSVMFRDMDRDTLPDLYVCNDFFYSRDQVWLHGPDQGYRQPPWLALRCVSVSSMAVDFADINRDGQADFFVSEMVSRRHAFRQRQRPEMMQGVVTQPLEDSKYRPETARNTLFLSRGDGTYAEIAQLAGVPYSEWSWGAVFLDVDLDGYEDLLIPTGNNHDVQDADVRAALASQPHVESAEARLANLRKYPSLLTPVVAFRNRRDLTFEDVGPRWGFTEPGMAQGMACADLDNDGDLDLVLNRMNQSAALYRNESSAPRIGVRLRGVPPNTRGIGARIEILGGRVTQSQEMICGGRYLSGDDSLRVFAADAGSAPLRIEVAWRSGKRTAVAGVQPNRLYELDETATAAASPPVPVRLPAFADVSAALDYRPQEVPFDDYRVQPLLSRKLSGLGPGVAWLDLNGDGWDDVVIGAGRGGLMGVYLNDRQGGWQRQLEGVWGHAMEQDQAGLAALPGPGQADALLASLSNYEAPAGTASSVLRYQPGPPPAAVPIEGFPAAAGPLALADVDGDGDLDAFVGGRVLAGRYPEPAASGLFLAEGAHFAPDARNAAVFERLGLVSGAVFSDLDGDGAPDLVLACEWGPLRVFRNGAGLFSEVTRPMGLADYTGWWNGVATGDLDGDGRLDVVASNWGRNTRFQLHLARPLHVFYGDFDPDGVLDLLEAYEDAELGKTVPWRDFETVRGALRFVSGRVTTFRDYGLMSVQELLGDAFAQATDLTAATLDSMVFFNRGDHFEARPLPVEAQFAPAFGVAVADFDGDGDEDVFLAQNFFQVEPGTSRYDGGRGLWLQNDGGGKLAAVPGQDSGVAVYGEQRGAALGDYDQDGRIDLLVGQQGQPPVLYRNATAKPGLRVRLQGPETNPRGVGATVRLRNGGKLGPARELHAGSGYWSQDSLTLVMGLNPPPTHVWVRWPGGRETTTPVPDGAREVHITAEP